MERHFTREQVAQVTLETHRPGPDEIVQVTNVFLLETGVPGIEQTPVWQVDFQKVYKEGTPFEQIYQSSAMLIEAEYYGKLQLWYLSRTALPEGCATPTEEDAIIQNTAIEAEQHRLAANQ